MELVSLSCAVARVDSRRRNLFTLGSCQMAEVWKFVMFAPHKKVQAIIIGNAST